MKCPFCGTNNQPGEDFCSNCGGYLAGSSGTADATVVGTLHSGGVTTGGGVNTGGAGSYTTGGGTVSSGTLTISARLQNGRYVVDKILGQGGMGAAVLARDTRVSNKTVVIKELISDNTDPAKRQEDVRNFELEVETLANLDHPLIPAVTDSFQEGSHYFMVQEYVPGENLEDHIEHANGPMPEKEVLTYASQILSILDYLAQQKPPIIHRDIKPANIIIGSRDKQAHLVDFGIARADVAKQAKKKQTTGLGTPGYAPPEQYQGNADTRSDLYALAATLHHALTNRDPRDFPPFNFPPARTLNPKLSPAVEKVLAHALQMNRDSRYQTAAEMKADIDEILTPKTIVPPPPRVYQQQQSARPQQAPVQPLPPRQPVHQAYQVQQQQHAGNNSWMRYSFIALIVVAALIGAFAVIAPRLNKGPSTVSTPTPGGNSATPITPIATPSDTASPISVKVVGNEAIGISDGTYAFDTNRSDGSLKQQAADALKKGDTVSAQSLLNQAIATESNDAEALIYRENLRIGSSPHITFIVGAMPSGDPSIVGVSRDTLQGAYLAQKEFNDGHKLPNGLRAKLLIASSGGQNANATVVANQIVQYAKSDPTFVGVMGWPFSGLTVAATQVLSQNQIPMVSSAASTDDLTGSSPYFFRVVPPNKVQGVAGAKYAQDKLGAKNVAVFSDPSDPYSQSLAQQFSQQFTSGGGSIAVQENYTKGKADTIQQALTDALSKNPDLIYFSGYASDVSPLLEGLIKANAPGNLEVLGGDALYELSGYSQAARPAYNRLRFTTFAFADEWGVVGQGTQEPAFYKEYPAAFSGGKTGYSFTRPTNDSIISYDAMYALLAAAASTNKATMTPTDIQQALTKTSFQGASGFIKFGSDGDPVNKALVILKISPEGFTQMDMVVGSLGPTP